MPIVTVLPLAPVPKPKNRACSRVLPVRAVAKHALQVGDEIGVAIHDAQKMRLPQRAIPPRRDGGDLGEVVLAPVLRACGRCEGR